MLSSQGDVEYKGETIRKNRLCSLKNSTFSRRSSGTPDENMKKISKPTSKKKKKDNRKEKKKPKPKPKKCKFKEISKVLKNGEDKLHFFNEQMEFKPELINIQQIQEEVD